MLERDKDDEGRYRGRIAQGSGPVDLSSMRPIDLHRLAGRLPGRPLTRFAPSPTGYLHLGHAANAIFVWGIARALGGRVLLRLEDHDRGRCRAEYEAALWDDLEWLGPEPDLGAVTDFHAGPTPYRQTDSGARYVASLTRLAQRVAVYACDCSRKDIAAEGGDEFNEDLLSSTGRQLRLTRLLGRESGPVFLHHPLILKPDGAKLSKASGDTGIRELRRAGDLVTSPPPT